MWSVQLFLPLLVRFYYSFSTLSVFYRDSTSKLLSRLMDPRLQVGECRRFGEPVLKLGVEMIVQLADKSILKVLDSWA